MLLVLGRFRIAEYETLFSVQWSDSYKVLYRVGPLSLSGRNANEMGKLRLMNNSVKK